MTELSNDKNIEANSEKPKPYIKYVLGTVAILAAWFAYNELSKPNPDNKSVDLTPIANEQPIKCADSWEMTGVLHGKTEWINGGIDSLAIENIKNDPRAVLNAWVNKIDNDPSLLAYFANKLDNANGNKNSDVKTADLIDKNICATDTAKQEIASIMATLDTAKISFKSAPSDGTNSIVVNHEATKATKPGIDGDKDAIQIELGSGTSIWILDICGNVVIKETKEVKTPKTPPKNTPKSSNPVDYKKLGDDNKYDSNVNISPKTTVAKVAESSPPKIDSTNEKVGSQTTIKASGTSETSKPITQNQGGTNYSRITD